MERVQAVGNLGVCAEREQIGRDGEEKRRKGGTGWGNSVKGWVEAAGQLVLMRRAGRTIRRYFQAGQRHVGSRYSTGSRIQDAEKAMLMVA